MLRRRRTPASLKHADALETHTLRPFTVLKTYSVLTLQPEHWEDTSKEPHASGDAPLSSPGDSRAKSVVTSNLANLADEPDPLGLYRGSVLS